MPSLKNNIISLFLLMFFVTQTSYSQVYQNDFCGHKDHFFNIKKEKWHGNNIFLEEYMDNFQLDSQQVYYRIPITFWLYQNNEGKKGAIDLDVKKQLNLLNYYYAKNQTGISFYLSEIKIINKTKRQNFGYMVEAPFVTTFNKENGSINVHVVNILQKNKAGGKKNLYKGTYNGFNKSITVVKYNTKAGLTHEIGHYLGLLHPHQNWNKGKNKQESVSRIRKKGKKRNCEVNGDKLCDTPAEPVLSDHFDQHCNYLGDLTDNWGDKYQPATNNIMSYQRYKSCREVFTPQQKAVMLYTLEKNKHNKGWKVSPENDKFSFDTYEPDNTKRMANSLKIDSLQHHTFHWIYKGKNKSDLDNTDWLRFKSETENNNGQNYIIYFMEGEKDFPKMKFTITDRNNKKILEQNLEKPDEININFRQDYYFFKIEKLEESQNIEDYKILISKK